MGAFLAEHFPKNESDKGVKINSIALSNEGSKADRSAKKQDWGFTLNAVDSKKDRITDLRKAFAYYTGVSPKVTPRELPRFGEQGRRRLVILQGLKGAVDQSGKKIPQWTILLNNALEKGFSAKGDEATELKKILNSVLPAPAKAE